MVVLLPFPSMHTPPSFALLVTAESVAYQGTLSVNFPNNRSLSVLVSVVVWLILVCTVPGRRLHSLYPGYSTVASLLLFQIRKPFKITVYTSIIPFLFQLQACVLIVEFPRSFPLSSGLNDRSASCR